MAKKDLSQAELVSLQRTFGANTRFCLCPMVSGDCDVLHGFLNWCGGECGQFPSIKAYRFQLRQETAW